MMPPPVLDGILMGPIFCRYPLLLLLLLAHGVAVTGAGLCPLPSENAGVNSSHRYAEPLILGCICVCVTLCSRLIYYFPDIRRQEQTLSRRFIFSIRWLSGTKASQ